VKDHIDPYNLLLKNILESSFFIELLKGMRPDDLKNNFGVKSNNQFDVLITTNFKLKLKT
jgi:hypothetical protein